MSMKQASNNDGASYTAGSHLQRCDLCENMRLCNESDDIVACRTCQEELLPSSWPL